MHGKTGKRHHDLNAKSKNYLDQSTVTSTFDQGFYSSVKFKFQKHSRNFPVVRNRTKLVYMGFKKVYTNIGYDDKSFFTFDYCK